jgi:hypothetical protein
VLVNGKLRAEVSAESLTGFYKADVGFCSVTKDSLLVASNRGSGPAKE